MRASAARSLGQVQVGRAMFSATVSSPNTSLSSGRKADAHARDPVRPQPDDVAAVEFDRARPPAGESP